MIKGIIFDLDGTLVKLPINYKVIFEKLRQLFDTNSEFKPLIPSIVDLSKGNEEILSKAFEIICDEEQKAVHDLEVIEGASDVLRYFQKNHLSLGLVTMQCKKAVEKVSTHLTEISVFSSIITRDESYDREKQIKKSMNNLGLNPDEVMMIGDRIHDVESAVKAGCSSILVNKDRTDFDKTRVVEKLSGLMKQSL